MKQAALFAESAPIVLPRVRRGDMWELGAHRMMCGDSRKAAHRKTLLGGCAVDLLFTSPPYKQKRDYLAPIDCWTSLMIESVGHVPLKSDGQILVNLGPALRGGEWDAYWNDWLIAMKRLKWKHRSVYVWDQMVGLPGAFFGRLCYAHEFVFHFNKKTKPVNKVVPCRHAGRKRSTTSLRHKTGVVLGMATSGEVLTHKTPDSVIRSPREKSNRTGHPAVFSVAFAKDIVGPFSSGGEICYDPFAGSGTVIFACQELGRICYCMEIEPAYCDMILRRWVKATGIMPRKVAR